MQAVGKLIGDFKVVSNPTIDQFGHQYLSVVCMNCLQRKHKKKSELLKDSNCENCKYGNQKYSGRPSN